MDLIFPLWAILVLGIFFAAQGFRTHSFSSVQVLDTRRRPIDALKPRTRDSVEENRKLLPFGHPQSTSRLFMAASEKKDGRNEEEFYEGMDAYEILGVSKTADVDTIKKAYQKAVATWHPDKFMFDEAKKAEGNKRMEKINRSWYILEDKDRRQRYDTYGEKGVGTSHASEEEIVNNGAPIPFPKTMDVDGDVDVDDEVDGDDDEDGGGGSGARDVSSIFEALFGEGFGNVRFGGMDDALEGFGGLEALGGMGKRAKAGAKKRRADSPDEGEEVTVEREISFMTSIFGGQENVRVRRLEACDTCTGTGVKPGAKIKTCGTCGGQGLVNAAQRTPFGTINSVTTCPRCEGSGEDVSERCAPCKGKGSVMAVKELKVQIPKGIEDGAVMRVKEGGSVGKRGGRRGDLIMQVSVKPDPRFQRDGNDIHSTEEISYTDAILGTTIRAEVADGPLSLKVPPGTQPGQRLRVKGKGAHKLNSETRGDAYVTIKVNIPTKLSAKERGLVEQLAEAQK